MSEGSPAQPRLASGDHVRRYAEDGKASRQIRFNLAPRPGVSASRSSPTAVGGAVEARSSVSVRDGPFSSSRLACSSRPAGSMLSPVQKAA